MKLTFETDLSLQSRAVFLPAAFQIDPRNRKNTAYAHEPAGHNTCQTTRASRVSRFSPANSRVPKLSTSQLGDDVVQICSHNIVKANQKWRPYLRGLLAKHFPANSKYVCSCFPCHRECSTQGPGRMAIGTTPRPGVSRMSAVHKPGQCQCCLPVFVVVCR